MRIASVRRGFLGTLILLVFCPGMARADERDEVVAFLKKNVLGRRLVHQSTNKMANNTLESEFHLETVYTNLQLTQDGFRFDSLSNVRQTNWDLDRDMKRTGEGRGVNRLVVVRYEFGVRQSTGRLLGHKTVIANSLVDPTGAAWFTMISIDKGKLVIKGTGVGYDDYFAKDGKFEPATADSLTVLEIKNGKLTETDTTTAFNVDPESLRRISKRSEIVNVSVEPADAK